MPDQIVLSTWFQRPLTRTEIQIFTWCGDERQAIALAKHITLPDNATAEQIATAVTLALVRAKEAASGPAEVEYIGGQRRDDKRVQ
jgi:hypothetical protein